MKKLVSLLLILVTVFSFASCALFEPEEKVFDFEGLSITLTEDFTETDTVKFDHCLESFDMIITIDKESFTSLGVTSATQLKTYGEMILQANDETDTELVEKEKYVYYYYTNEVDGTNYCYYAVMYKGTDAFWLLNFAVTENGHAKLKPQIFKYADSVTVS